LRPGRGLLLCQLLLTGVPFIELTYVPMLLDSVALLLEVK